MKKAKLRLPDHFSKDFVVVAILELPVTVWAFIVIVVFQFTFVARTGRIIVF